MSVFLITAPREYTIPVRPSRTLSRLLGPALDPEDLLIPREIQALLTYPELYSRQWQSAQSKKDVGSTVAVDKDKFQVSLDVQQFKPEEISVKITDENTITVEGKHEERQDEHGYISRHFVRKYILPKGHDINKVESRLSSDGVLTITAPKENQEQIEHRTIPITQTGQPSKPVEQKPEAEKKE